MNELEEEEGGLERALKDFVSDWRSEISRNREGECSGEGRKGSLALGKRDHVGDSSPVKRQKDCGDEPPPLLVLPPGCREEGGRGLPEEVPLAQEQSLVDKLIEDLVSQFTRLLSS